MDTQNRKYEVFTEQSCQYISTLIDSALGSLSVNIESKGGRYMREMLYILLTEQRTLPILSEPLTRIAARHGVAAESIRSSIRYAVVNAWQKGDPEMQYRYFGHSVEFRRGKPTESAFISTVAMRLRHEVHAYMKQQREPCDGIPPEMKLQ